MLHSFHFQDGQVRYGCNYLETMAFTSSLKEERLCSREFATEPSMSLGERVVATLRPQGTDNANVNVGRIGDTHVALTETPTVTEFELATLKTVGAFKFDDRLSGQITTAHPHYSKNCYFNILTNVSASCSYDIYRLDHGSRKRVRLVSLPVKRPAYLHSFAITERFVILVEFPLLLSPLELLLSGKPYIRNFHWRGKKETRLHIIDKNGGNAKITTIDCEPCFAFHHVNAMEMGQELLIDVLTYSDASIIDALTLSNLRDNFTGLPPSKLQRFVVNIDKKTMFSEIMCEFSLELPRINYGYCNGRSYSFTYCVGCSSPVAFLDQIVKVDVSHGDTKVWREDGCYPGEPVFVAKNDRGVEDDGVIMSLVLDTKAKNSFLLLLDATTFEELARLRLPHVVTLGFHGQFFGANN